jgi:hypothetical protein
LKRADYNRLVAAGMTPDQIGLVMDMFDERDEERKAGQRARWRKSQENKRNAHVSSREPTLANVPRGGVTRVEDKTSNSEIEPQREEKKETPLSRLRVVLDDDHARAVIDHRQRLRKPLTEHAAKLLADKFRRCPDPNAAADAMIANGWLRVELEWLDKPPARAGPRAKSRGVGGVFSDLVEHLENGRQEDGSEPAGAVVLRISDRAASG